MRVTPIALVATLLAPGCGKPPEAPPPPAVTERAKPVTAPAKKAEPARESGGGFEFEDRGGGTAAPAPAIDAKRRLAPSMEELEAKMAAVAAEAAVPRVWVCGTCGAKAREPGTCCGRDRTPAK